MNPVIKSFFKVVESQSVDSVEDSDKYKKSYPFAIINKLGIKGLLTLNAQQLEPFIDRKYSKEVYEFFKSDSIMRKKCMLEILSTVVFLYNYMNNINLEDYYIDEIKVSWIFKIIFLM